MTTPSTRQRLRELAENVLGEGYGDFEFDDPVPPAGLEGE